MISITIYLVSSSMAEKKYKESRKPNRQWACHSGFRRQG